MKPLLTPPAAAEWGNDEYAAVGALFGMPGDDVPRAGSGEPRDPLNFDILGVLVRHPAMAREFLAYNAFLLQRGELPLRLRELAVLRFAHVRRSAFFWGEHFPVATAGGLPEADIARLARGNDEFDGVDRLVLQNHRPTARRWSSPRADVRRPRRATRHASGDGTHLRRRHLRDVGGGLRRPSDSQRLLAARTCPGASTPDLRWLADPNGEFVSGRSRIMRCSRTRG